LIAAYDGEDDTGRAPRDADHR
jgi:hypothetical protein